MNSEVMNVSKLLSECADWCSNTPPYEEYYPDEDKFQAWATAIRSVIIPPPGEHDIEFVNQKCHKCGMITSNMFACGHCKDPSAIFGHQND